MKAGMVRDVKKGQKMLITIGIFVILAVSSLFDIRRKIIPVQIFAVGGIFSVICMAASVLHEGWGALPGTLAGLLPGAGLLLLGFMTEHKVGYGDGILLMILGLAEGVRKVLLIFCIGLFLQSVLAVFLVLLKKAVKQTQIPFVPFLFAARVLCLFL